MVFKEYIFAIKLGNTMKTDEYYMREALKLAQQASELDEVPVGALIVNHDGVVIGVGFNTTEQDQCALKHAELIAIDRACSETKSWRLDRTTLYVTLEPCLMCMGAIFEARIKRVVYAASNKRLGGCGGLVDLRTVHPYASVLFEKGPFAEISSQLLIEFFKNKRH